MNNKFKKIVLLAGDVIILYFSLHLTLVIRYGFSPRTNPWEIHFWPFTLIFFLWLIIFYISNLYNLNLAVNNAKFFQLSARAIIVAVLASIAFFYLIPHIGIAPKRNLFIYIIIFSLLFFLWRRFYNWSLKSYLPKNSLAIVGYNSQVKEIINEIADKKHLGYKLDFIIDDNNTYHDDARGIEIIKNIPDLPKYIKNKNINSIILNSDPRHSEDLRLALFNCLPLKINFIGFPDFYESITGKVPIDSINQIWFLENLNEGGKKIFDLIKRVYDIIIALLIISITLPFWLIIAIIIKLESRGPVFMIMPRLGRDNKIFKLIKFRSMREENNDRSPTKANDPRITKFGMFLRKTRLDELPQFINIILGDMSLVGPRPERPELCQELEKTIPFYGERMLVKPGLTGSDQISGEYHSPSVEDSIKKLQYDLFYIKNRSIYLDISIILKTIATVLSRNGL